MKEVQQALRTYEKIRKMLDERAENPEELPAIKKNWPDEWLNAYEKQAEMLVRDYKVDRGKAEKYTEAYIRDRYFLRDWF